MSYSDLINSPIFIALVGLAWGSLVASGVSAFWQKRSHLYEVKLQYTQNIISAYQDYTRLIRSDVIQEPEKGYDILHPRIVSYSRIIEFIFKNKSIGRGWKKIVDNLSSAYDLRLQGRNRSVVERQLDDIYPKADLLIQMMFKELA